MRVNGTRPGPRRRGVSGQTPKSPNPALSRFQVVRFSWGSGLWEPRFDQGRGNPTGFPKSRFQVGRDRENPTRCQWWYPGRARASGFRPGVCHGVLRGPGRWAGCPSHGFLGGDTGTGTGPPDRDVTAAVTGPPACNATGTPSHCGRPGSLARCQWSTCHMPTGMRGCVCAPVEP
jgi:hypothetical protein